MLIASRNEYAETSTRDADLTLPFIAETSHVICSRVEGI
jgi:hypothetical protein